MKNIILIFQFILILTYNCYCQITTKLYGIGNYEISNNVANLTKLQTFTFGNNLFTLIKGDTIKLNRYDTSISYDVLANNYTITNLSKRNYFNNFLGYSDSNYVNNNLTTFHVDTLIVDSQYNFLNTRIISWGLNPNGPYKSFDIITYPNPILPYIDSSELSYFDFSGVSWLHRKQKRCIMPNPTDKCYFNLEEVSGNWDTTAKRMWMRTGNIEIDSSVYDPNFSGQLVNSRKNIYHYSVNNKDTFYIGHFWNDTINNWTADGFYYYYYDSLNRLIKDSMTADFSLGYNEASYYTYNLNGDLNTKSTIHSNGNTIYAEYLFKFIYNSNKLIDTIKFQNTQTNELSFTKYFYTPYDFNTIPNYLGNIKELKNDIRLYPNPSNSILNIEIPKDYGQVRFITIMNLKGDIIEKIDQVNPKNIINISNYSSGTYIIDYVGSKFRPQIFIKQ